MLFAVDRNSSNQRIISRRRNSYNNCFSHKKSNIKQPQSQPFHFTLLKLTKASCLIKFAVGYFFVGKLGLINRLLLLLSVKEAVIRGMSITRFTRYRQTQTHCIPGDISRHSDSEHIIELRIISLFNLNRIHLK